MANKYTIIDQKAVHFLTFTVHQFVDVFTRQHYIEILINSIKHCQKEKGLRVYGWVIMTNHTHFIFDSEGESLSDIIRDMKKFTSKKIFESIETNDQESRKRWLLWLLKKDNNIWFWEEGYHGEEIWTKDFFEIKLNYVHQNPVKAGVVEKEEDYLWSSAGDYYGSRKGALELVEF
ncbi:MAG: transposase [Bacteroidota bacterium]